MGSSNAKQGINVAAFILVVIFNALGAAGILGPSQGDVSDRYKTKITPAGFAFSIWGVIYFFQAAFIIWQILPGQKENTLIVDRISWWYLASSLCNIAWIIVFGQGTVVAVQASSALILLILVCLLGIYVRTSAWLRTNSTIPEFILIDIAFSLYAGWVTVASIVNVAVAFVAGGNKTELWGVDASVWAVIMLWVAFAVNVLVVLTRRDPVFPGVLAWATNAIRVENSNTDATVEEAAFAVSIAALVLAILALIYQIWYATAKRHCSFQLKRSNKGNYKEGKAGDFATGKPLHDDGTINQT